MERIGPVFQQVYGQTENLGYGHLAASDEHDAAEVDRLTSCGRAVLGATVAILDDDGSELPPGVIGEVCTRGRATMTGYRNLPDQTAAVLRDG